MAEMMVFYTNPMSRGRIAHWMLEEVGEPYEVKLLAFDKGEHKRAEFLSVNPMGKVPALIHRGVVITEAAAICAYLADAFPAKKLAPALDDPRRGTYLRWMFFGASCIEAALTDKAFPRAEAPHAGTLGYGSYDSALASLEHALTPGPWILGDEFSAADVYVGSQVGWGLMFKTLEPRPVFQAYAARCNERPAMQRMIELNNGYAAKLKG